ncbi:MAG: UbiA family prenyltransferase [Planctomycetota bacterium]|nr:UbiA family prenyltransferase [Planctomycetota bacterium]MDG2309949.1 UbiA family prenyltransferase [Planctomycetota bacterium]
MNWLRLARIALLPTIAWDFTVGILLATGSLANWPWLAFVAVALIYHGSMILNDVADLKIDIAAQRKRPLVRKEISQRVALFVGLFMYCLAAGICYLYFKEIFDLSLYLIATVLVYNFSPSALRKHIGPAFLATARAFSLMFGAAALLGPAQALNDIAYTNIMCYALYFLFLSRMAQHEEDGIAGMRGFSFVGMACLAPFLLLAADSYSPVLVVCLLGFAAFAGRHAWACRGQYWSQEIVQAQTRSSLCLAPVVLGLCLLASEQTDNQWLALVSIGVVVLTTTLAKSFTIE